MLSVDADYDGLQRLTLGGKYAFRCGQPRDGRDLSAPWFHRVDPEQFGWSGAIDTFT